MIAIPKLKPFRFEKFWLTHPDFQELSQQWWENAEIHHGTRMYRFQQRLKNFKHQLRQWNKDAFGNIFHDQKEIEQKLEDIQKRNIQTGHTDAQQQQEEDTLKRQLEERYKQEEILWKQKSRVQWLKEGDKNSKFFHRSMIHRRFINRITKLEDNQGNTILTHREIEMSCGTTTRISSQNPPQTGLQQLKGSLKTSQP
jgi:hypothetical protein